MFQMIFNFPFAYLFCLWRPKGRSTGIVFMLDAILLRGFK